jgi:hypothetical protein
VFVVALLLACLGSASPRKRPLPAPSPTARALRVFDISNARLPKEVGYFMPPDPVKRYGPVPTKFVEQTEDVLVDRRGYITNKNQGLWVLRYTGPRPTATN